MDRGGDLMANEDRRALQAKLAADQRVAAWIKQRYPNGTRGGAEIPADVLRGFGYEAPEGFGVAVQGGNARVYDKHDKWDVIIPLAAATIMTAGMALPAAGSAAPAAATGTGATVAGTAGPSTAGTLLRYGLQYGAPIVGNLIGQRMQTNAQGESDRAMQDYYNKALQAEIEERDYRRGFDEEGRRYDREFGEEGRRYGRYSDTYGRESDEEDRGYDRAGDTYGRLSDEEILAYDRSQAIRDKNYGYQQYGNFVETLEPYRAGGSASASRMSQLMGGPATADTGSYLNLANTARNSVQAVPNVPGRPTWDYKGTRPTWNYPSTGNAGGQPSPSGGAEPPVSTTMPVGGGTQLVRVQAPDGEVREMSPAMAQSAVRLGARII